MYFFVNDYNSICYPELLDALKDCLDEKNIGYGFDDHSENARNLIRGELGDFSCDIHFVPGGTSANILGVACGMRQQDSVLACTSGHIQGHEAGSIEATGLKIELIQSPTGKLTRALLEKNLAKFQDEFTTSPKKVYISNTTELGEVYTKREIEEIYSFCKDNGLYLFIDGARIASALVADKCDYTLKDLSSMCDIFYLGGTKVGFIFGEAIVIKNEDLKKDFLKLIKQKGAMLAKGFVSGIMWERVFSEEGFYLRGSKLAFARAKELAIGLENLGYDLAYPFSSNQVFVKVSDDTVAKWQKIAHFEIMGEDDQYKLARLVTSFRTKASDVEGFLNEI
ncbi:beta-eliminating lyase-related protein [uncultured Anaerococcus sp.]|uniref:threonine aldolase family protein n=1 Tax=uncultured Anaerococcus sp. TaxID=293428 RepID=UPI0026208187|nr:beta-eliminating lyase-related protein [uncultured Anaerococcus sp.]